MWFNQFANLVILFDRKWAPSWPNGQWFNHVAGLLADRYTGTLLEPIRPNLKNNAERPFSCLSDHPKLPPILESSSRKIWLYALVDPRDGTVRYIGVTGAPRSRLNWHLQAPQRCLVSWVTELASCGRQPRLVVLGRTCKIHWQNTERRWISFFRSHGALYNESDGGLERSGAGQPRSVGAKRAASTERRYEFEAAKASSKPRKRRRCSAVQRQHVPHGLSFGRPLKPPRLFEPSKQ